MQYQYVKELDGENSEHVIKKIDNDLISFVPNDPGNVDWQAYQEWLALGNEPLPAE